MSPSGRVAAGRPRLGKRRAPAAQAIGRVVAADRRASYHGLTLVEALVSVIVVSTMLVAALNCVGAARTNELRLVERERAVALGVGLLSEILRQAYADPENGPASFGLGGDENTGNRSRFDDVDDYNGWSASPPQFKDGAVIPGCPGYEQGVTVARVNANDLQTVSASNTGVKRIVVTSGRSGRPVVTLTAYRTAQWADPAAWAGAVWP